MPFMSPKDNQPDNLILSRRQIRECDRVALEKFSLNGLVLMENAGAAAARKILSLLNEKTDKRVCIVAGTGNNAGDGFVVARHLDHEDIAVEIIICGEKQRIKGDALSNLLIIERMELPIDYFPQERLADLKKRIIQCGQHADLIVDALLGTGTAGPPREPIRTAIETINCLNLTVVALDIPSGLDCDSGLPLEVAVRAGHTVTFAARKKGFFAPGASDYTGTVTLASIGINTRRLLKTTLRTGGSILGV